MWSQSDQTIENGGGFIHGDDNKTGISKDDSKSRRNFASVNIQQIKQLFKPKHGLIIYGHLIGGVKILGRVQSVNEQTTMLTFVIKDDTGSSIEVDLWNTNSTNGFPVIIEDAYVIVYGKVRPKDDQPFIAGFNVQPVKSYNEITVHCIEVITHAKMLENHKISVLMNKEQSTNFNFASTKQTPFPINNEPNPSGMNQVHKMVLRAISSSQAPEGISINDISKSLPSIDKNQLKKYVDFLSNEGHIYSTIDENHFRSTDQFDD